MRPRGVEASDPGGEGTEMASSWVVSMDLHSKHVISCLYFFLLDLNIHVLVIQKDISLKVIWN